MVTLYHLSKIKQKSTERVENHVTPGENPTRTRRVFKDIYIYIY